jgi:hypothetical protein
MWLSLIVRPIKSLHTLDEDYNFKTNVSCLHGF